MQKKILLTLSIAVAFPAMVEAAESAPAEVTIGLVDTFAPEFYIDTYAPTLDHLMASLGKYRFRIVEVDRRSTESDIQRLKPNFIVASASAYVSLIEPFGAHQVATKEPVAAQDAVHSVASAFVVRSDSPAKTLSDLRGRRVVATSESSFDGWLIAAGELARRGFDPVSFFREKQFTDYAIPGPALLVKLGVADVAVMASCDLERLEAAGQVKVGELRVVDDASGGEGCRRSTERFPDVVFASLAGVSPEIVRDVTVALLSMPTADRDFVWTIADDFLPTYRLLKSLNLPPYAVQPLTLQLLWQKYRTEILLLLGLALAVVFHIVSINLLVQRRTRQLKESLAETKHYFEEAQTSRVKLARLERLHIVNQLSSIFAHEVKQPLMNISLYAEALKLFLKKRGALDEKAENFLGRITAEVNRSSAIVEHVRGYAKKRETKKERLKLSDAVAASVRTAGGKISPEVSVQTDAWVMADPFEIRFILTNFLKNAEAAVAKEKQPQISITSGVTQRRAFVSVEDNGPSLSDEAFAALGTMGRSTKEDGLGFGLAIASSLAEKSGGHITFERVDPQGLRVTLVIDVAEEGEEEK